MASDETESAGPEVVAEDPGSPTTASASDVDERAVFAPDADELVGPGRYTRRIQPAAALLPGVHDARRLMIAWFIRKSFYWMFFLGWMTGSMAAFWSRGDVDFDVDLTSPDSVREGLASPWAALLLAFIIRLVNNWVALGLAYPLALGHEPSLSERTSFGSGIGKFFDRMHVARAFRSLRWTHHVRAVALGRLGATGRRLGKLDPILDIVNVAAGVSAFIVLWWISVQLA